MSGGIFISYRRDDTRQAAGRLADDLGEAFGAERIFRDIEKIEIGVDFTQSLQKALDECEVMLVLIGRQWSGIVDAQGARRLERADDWIRAEIVTALKRGIRVVPVLVDGAALPSEAELPEDLRPLVRRQALEIEDARWRSDVARLVEGLGRMPGLAPKGATAAVPPPPPVVAPAAPAGMALWKKVAGGVAALIAIVLVVNKLGGDGSPTTAGAAPQPMTWKFDNEPWYLTFKPWDAQQPAVDVRNDGPQGAIFQTGTGTWSADGREIVLKLDKAPGYDVASECTLRLNEAQDELKGQCSDDGGPRQDVRLTRR